MAVFKRIALITLLLLVLFFGAFYQADAEQLLLQPLPEGPSHRLKHSAIYDSEHNEMVIFGGADSVGWLNEVWKLNLGTLTWSEVAASGDIPAARQSHSAIYDPPNKRMIIFGGYQNSVLYNDLYSLDLNTNIWSTLSPGGALPNPRWNHSAIYNPTDSSMVIFGGRDPYNWFNDIWRLDLKTLTWSQISPSGPEPSSRECHSSTYIPTGNYMLVFGAYMDHNWGNDLWKFDFATNSWTQISPGGDIPLPRGSHSAYYDSLNNRLVIFGGIGTNWLMLDDIWQLDLSSFVWKNLFPLVSRESQSGIYDPQRMGLMIFGGKSYPSNYIFDDGYVVTTREELPFSYGDANCDGKINITDIIYLVNYQFKGGPAPCSPGGNH